MDDNGVRDQRRCLYAEVAALDASAADRVAELLGSLTEAVRAEPGNIAFDAYRKRDNPAQFFVHEVYVDDAAFQFHLGQEHGRVFNDEIVGLVHGGASALTWLTPLRATA